MSVGGHIIEIKHVHGPETGRPLIRFWVVDRAHGDETLVHAAPPVDGILPALGDEIWWQAGRIYFDHDRRSLTKVGASGDAWFGRKRPPATPPDLE